MEFAAIGFETANQGRDIEIGDEKMFMEMLENPQGISS